MRLHVRISGGAWKRAQLIVLICIAADDPAVNDAQLVRCVAQSQRLLARTFTIRACVPPGRPVGSGQGSRADDQATDARRLDVR
jgi:hypothetical protein